MMKIVKMLLLASFFMVGLFPVCQVSANADDSISSVISEIRQNGKSEVYVVKKGDTLWDLSEHFYLSPWQWPDLWRNNPEIMDPHWIYPGNKLIVYPRKKKSQVEPAAKPVKKPVVEVKEVPDTGMVAIPQKNNFCPILFSGHDDNFPRVTGGTGENDWLVDGDRFFYDDKTGNLVAGTQVKVLRYVDKVSLQGKKYHLYQEIAIARIDNGNGDGKLQGELLSTQSPVGPNDRLIPFQAFPEKVKPQPGLNSVKVSVLVIEKERKLADFGSFVVLDQGSNAGVKNGSLFAVYDRDNPFWRNPSSKIYTDKYADIMVTRVFSDYAIGIVTNLHLPFSSGVRLAGENVDFSQILPQ